MSRTPQCLEAAWVLTSGVILKEKYQTLFLLPHLKRIMLYLLISFFTRHFTNGYTDWVLMQYLGLSLFFPFSGEKSQSAFPQPLHLCPITLNPLRPECQPKHKTETVFVEVTVICQLPNSIGEILVLYWIFLMHLTLLIIYFFH